MKISIVGPVYPYRGGIAHYTTALVQELTASGHQVQAISFKRQYPKWLYPGQTDKETGAVHHEASAAYTLDPIYIWTWAQAVRQIADFQPELVIIQWWITFWAPAYYWLAWALNRRGIPCVFCIHNVIPHDNRLPDVWLARAVLSRGNALITLSPKESKRLAGLLPAARVYESNLPVPEVSQLAQDRASAQREIGIPSGQPVLLFLGFVRPYKGVQVLLDALGALREENIRPFLVIAGEFWDNIKDYQKKIEALCLTDQVQLENRYVPNEELSRFYNAADAFVAPHIHGTQSGAIKMAISYGLPILASSQISSDLPVDSYPVYVHQAGDSRDLARSIREFLKQDHPVHQAKPARNDWAEIISLVERIGNELKGETNERR